MSQKTKREQWEQHLADFEGSGQTAVIWCKEQDIQLANFYYWKRRIRTVIEDAKVSPISWLPLEFDLKSPSGEMAAEQISIEIGGKFKVIIQKGFDREMFRDVVSILQQQ